MHTSPSCSRDMLVDRPLCLRLVLEMGPALPARPVAHSHLSGNILVVRAARLFRSRQRGPRTDTSITLLAVQRLANPRHPLRIPQDGAQDPVHPSRSAQSVPLTGVPTLQLLARLTYTAHRHPVQLEIHPLDHPRSDIYSYKSHELPNY